MGSTVFYCCRLGIHFVNHLSNFWHTGFISEFTIFKKCNGKLKKKVSTLANRLALAASKIIIVIYFAFTLLKIKLLKFFLFRSWTE